MCDQDKVEGRGYADNPRSLGGALQGSNQSFRYKDLDTSIKNLEIQIEQCSEQIKYIQEDSKRLNIQLEEMKKVRKLVTPKDEARIQQLRNLGLV